MPPQITAAQAADHLIALAHRRGEAVSNLKLQKLLYYAQAWHLARFDRPLFPERFQAWMSGPVIPEQFWRFRPRGIHAIPPSSTAADLPPHVAAFLDEAVSEYLRMDEWDLEWLACAEDPWLIARGGIDRGDPCTTEIGEDEMRRFYRALARAA